jgi:ubiquinone biosynthesis UbiH/UbiF/VisC/COQ6 family hydroxylase
MHFDIAIVGGGMVGGALAASLKNTERRVALIDSSPVNFSEDARLIALNETSVAFFKRLDLWSSLEPYATSIKSIHVSHRGHFAITRIHGEDFNIPALGYVVPAKYINSAIYSTLANATNITLIRPATLHAFSQSDEGVSLTLNQVLTTQSLRADVMIGADGSFSTVRDILNIPVEKIDYQQSALVTSTLLQRNHHNMAYERFVKEGAIAMLPLPGHRAATIWTASNEAIKELVNLSDDAFLKTLQHHFGYRLGRFLSIENRVAYPLQLLRAKQLIKENVLLIGNAAHTFHPIASQGLNLALYEVAHLMTFFLSSTEKLTFRTFQIDRAQEQFSKRLSHHLTWIFSADHFILNVARQIGMIGLDILPGLKKQFALRAMGKNLW